MPRFLKGVLCVVETFRRYASEDGDKATLTCSELRQLLQGEFGDVLQPHAIHAVERNLNLLDVDSHCTISFDEFVLAIFSFLNLHHFGLPSLRNSEPRQVSKSEQKEADEELADLQEQTTSGKPPHTQRSTGLAGDSGTAETQEPGKDADRTPSEPTESDAPEDFDVISETQESPGQERECEAGEPPVQGGSRSVSETCNIGAEKVERRSPEAQIRAEQKVPARKTGPLSSEAQTQELQGPSAEKDTGKDSEVRGLSSAESSQNQPGVEGPSTPGEEAHRAESHTAQASANSRNGPAATETPGAGGRTQESAPPEKLLEGEDDRTARPGDKPTQEEDGSQGEDPESSVTRNEEGSCETPNSRAPGEGNRMQGDSQTQADPRKGVHNNHPDPPQQGAPDEDDSVQEVVVLWVGGEDTQLPEGHESQGSETKSPSAAVELDGRPEAQESTAGGENRKFPEAETPGGLEADFANQVSRMQLPEKGSSRKELKIQRPGTKKEEGGAPETEETLLKNLEEHTPASPKTHLEREEPAASGEEDRSPQEQAGEGGDQQNPAKKQYNSSVFQSGAEGRRVQRDQEPRSAERGVVRSRVQYHCLQEKMVQQVNITQDEHQQHQTLEDQQGPPQREAPVPQTEVKAKKQ